MNVRSMLDGLPAELADPCGDVLVAVLDGPVDLSHPCFDGSDLRQIDTLVEDPAGPGPMSLHGTHIASLIFGQPDSLVAGLAPGCRGLILPVFRDDGQRLSQVDLARAVEAAVREGADIVNISGGEPAPTGEPDPLLANALALCAANGVLVVAAVGNEGTDGVQVPAACPGVLAVGACTPDGEPLPTNNRGASYRENGVLAPGLDIEGANPAAAPCACPAAASPPPPSPASRHSCSAWPAARVETSTRPRCATSSSAPRPTRRGSSMFGRHTNFSRKGRRQWN